MRTQFQYGRSLTVALCLTASLIASTLADYRAPDSLAKPLESIDTGIGGWTEAEQQTIPPAVLEKLRPSNYIARTYLRNSRRLDLFIAYYSQQRAGESMHSPKSCLPGNGWTIVRQGSATISLDGKKLELNQYRVQNAGAHMLVFYWYQSRNRIIANEYLGKLFLIRDAIFGGYTSGSLVRILLPDDADAVQEGPAFAQVLIPQVQRCFSY
jgi:EpsI family protein